MRMSCLFPVLPASVAVAAPEGRLSGPGMQGYLIDLAVVIIGVTAAFVLNSLREGFLRRKLERKYIRGFEKDIDSDLEALREIVELETAKKGRAISFVESLRNGTQTLESSMEIVVDMMTMVQFRSNRTTYNSLVNSGDSNSAGSFGFRADLVRLYGGYDETAAKEGMLREYVSRFAMPFVYKHVDLMGGSFPDPAVTRGPGFRNLVLGYYALLQQNLGAYADIERTAGEFRAGLKCGNGRTIRPSR